MSFVFLPDQDTWATLSDEGELIHFDEAKCRVVAAAGKHLARSRQFAHIQVEHSLAVLCCGLLDAERAKC